MKKPVLFFLALLITAGIRLFAQDTLPKFSVINAGNTRVNPVVIRLDGFPGTDSVVTPNPVTIKNRTTGFVPSIYVYTCRDGYVCIRLPDHEKPKKYSIKFFDNDQTFLFELKEVKEQ